MHFLFDLTEGYRQHKRIDKHYDATDNNNNASFEGLDIHYHKYHSPAYQTCCDASDNVCLDIDKCHYSIYSK